MYIYIYIYIYLSCYKRLAKFLFFLIMQFIIGVVFYFLIIYGLKIVYS